MSKTEKQPQGLAWFKYGVLPFMIIFVMGLAQAHMTFNLETFFRATLLTPEGSYGVVGREAPLVVAISFAGLAAFVALGVWLRFIWASKVSETGGVTAMRKTVLWGVFLIFLALSWSYRGNGMYAGWLAWWADESMTFSAYSKALSSYFWFLPVVLSAAGLYWARPVAAPREVSAS